MWSTLLCYGSLDAYTQLVTDYGFTVLGAALGYLRCRWEACLL